jgi:hypothetical protein
MDQKPGYDYSGFFGSTPLFLSFILTSMPQIGMKNRDQKLEANSQ